MKTQETKPKTPESGAHPAAAKPDVASKMLAGMQKSLSVAKPVSMTVEFEGEDDAEPAEDDGSENYNPKATGERCPHCGQKMPKMA